MIINEDNILICSNVVDNQLEELKKVDRKSYDRFVYAYHQIMENKSLIHKKYEMLKRDNDNFKAEFEVIHSYKTFDNIKSEIVKIKIRKRRNIIAMLSNIEPNYLIVIESGLRDETFYSPSRKKVFKTRSDSAIVDIKINNIIRKQ